MHFMAVKMSRTENVLVLVQFLVLFIYLFIYLFIFI